MAVSQVCRPVQQLESRAITTSQVAVLSHKKHLTRITVQTSPHQELNENLDVLGAKKTDL